MIDLVAALRAVVDAFERSDARYLLVGSVAASLWGVARTTRDVDVVAILRPEDIDSLAPLLADDGFYVPLETARAAVPGGGGFNVLHTPTGGKVDVFVAHPSDEFTIERLQRRVRAEVLGIQTWVATPEDVILAKLRWRLTSRSEVQWRDCVELVAINELDRDYLDRWAVELGVAADLTDLLREVKGG